MANRFLSLDDLNNMPAPQWLIDGLFEAKSLVMLAGPSYSFKSFLLLDWLLCMASGRKWMNRPTVPCKVAYALGEGKSSLLKRVIAWVTYNDLDKEEQDRLNANFKITFEVPQLAVRSSVDNFLADLAEEDYNPDVIAIDTFARSFVGLDENDAKDTGMWIEGADRLRQLDYGVIFLHHTKKNTEFGVQYRGSTAIIGAMDTAMTLVRDNNYATLSVTKQKDHDEGAPMRFRRVLVDVGGSEESCILTPAPILDERFSIESNPNVVDINTTLTELMNDPKFESDRARAKELASRAGISLGAAKTRISRAKK